MCGRLNVIDDPGVRGLCQFLGVDLGDEQRIQQGRFIGAANPVSIIHQTAAGQPQVNSAIWWLLLEATDSGFKPSRYTSFNSRYDKLNQRGSAAYKPYRQSRCIIPVKGFGETQGSGKNACYTDFAAAEGAIALGGLYRQWVHNKTGEQVYSCSVVTLPPHPALKEFHQKSTPLILPQNDIAKTWLDSGVDNVEQFEPLLNTALPQDLIATPIDKPSSFNPIGPTLRLAKDKAS